MFNDTSDEAVFRTNKPKRVTKKNRKASSGKETIPIQETTAKTTNKNNNINIYFKVVGEIIFPSRSSEKPRRDPSHPGASSRAPHPNEMLIV
jgi:hypothetical protein